MGRSVAVVSRSVPPRTPVDRLLSVAQRGPPRRSSLRCRTASIDGRRSSRALGPASARLALGWKSALRRSKIARLLIRDVKIKYDVVSRNRYLEVFVATSKTDQEGKGRYLQITEMPGRHPLCAMRAIEAWIERSAISVEGVSSAELRPSTAFRSPCDSSRRRHLLTWIAK
jgi:hypothetical protein